MPLGPKMVLLYSHKSINHQRVNIYMLGGASVAIISNLIGCCFTVGFTCEMIDSVTMMLIS